MSKPAGVTGRTGTTLNIYVPLSLKQRLNKLSRRINVSRVCADALTFEVERAEREEAETWEQFLDLIGAGVR